MNEFRSNFSETRGKHRVAFVQSCWHRDIVDEMRDAFTETFQGLGEALGARSLREDGAAAHGAE